MRAVAKYASVFGLIVVVTGWNVLFVATQARAASTANAAVNPALPSGHVDNKDRQKIFYNAGPAPVVVTIEFSANDHGALLIAARDGKPALAAQFRSTSEHTRNILAVTVGRDQELEINLVPNVDFAGSVGGAIEYQFLSIR